MPDRPVIDADGHVMELPELRDYLEPRWQRARLMPSDCFDRTRRGLLGQTTSTPQAQLAAMDQDGIDVMVIFPSAGLSIGFVREEEYAAAYARAYNRWMHDFCAANPDRLKFVALLAPRLVDEAALELRYAVEELGAVGGMLPTHVPLRPDWGHRQWDPIYAEAERLDVGIAFHASMGETVGYQRFDKFINVHALGHPVEQMMALCATVIGGVFERFPRLRTAHLESGVGWVPYLMDRLDEEFELRGEDDAPHLTKRPSEYITGGRIFFGVECGEKTLPHAVDWALEDALLYSSDYPHWDGDWPDTVRTIRSRGDLSDAVKRKLLSENALRFYGPRLGIRAAPTTHSTTSAAS